MCKRCAHGRFAEHAAQSACDDFAACDVGTELRGHSATSSGACAPCESGRYKDTGTEGHFAETCLVIAGCAAGTERKGHSTTSSGECVTCKRNAFKVAGESAGHLATCAAVAPCPAGQARSGHSSVSQGACFPCLAGQFKVPSDDVDAKCQRCPAGKYQPNLASASCTECARGTVQNTEGAFNCVACHPGHYQGQSGQAVCSALSECPAGMQRTHNTRSSAGYCAACAAGQAKTNNGKWDTPCSECASGRYAESAASACTLCAGGTYQDAPGKGTCDKCVAGKFSAATGRNTARDCEFCPAGKFSERAGSIACLACASGTFGSPQYRNNHAGHCVSCTKGQFQQHDGSTSCESCASGFYQHKPQQTHCHPCSEENLPYTGGRIDALRFYWTEEAAGRDRCVQHPLDCKPGPWSEFGTCTKSCGGGFQTKSRTTLYQAWGGGKACALFDFVEIRECNTMACPVDCEVSVWGGWDECSKSCGSGVHTRTRHMVRPASHAGASCPVLTDTGTCNENPCPTDCTWFWMDWSPCSKACGVGRKTRERELTLPTHGGKACPAKQEIAACNTDCCAGKFHTQSGACVACAAGHFAEREGQAMCTACPQGKYGAGTDRCEACPSGTFQPAAAAASLAEHCTHCPRGKYQEHKSSVACVTCPLGHYSLSSRSLTAESCLACATGQFSNVAEAHACKACAVGTYQDVFGQTSCKDCEAGRYNPYPGRSVDTYCLNCPCGKWSTKGSNVCAECPAGRWRAGERGVNTASCTPTARGRFAATAACGSWGGECSGERQRVRRSEAT